MNNELFKRIATSLLLIVTLFFMVYSTYVLIISLITISIISFIEFNALIARILTKKKIETIFIKLSINLIVLFYLTFFCFLIFNSITQVVPNFKFNMIYLISVCVCSDTGGFIFGKIFNGRKLTKISPNKTVAGSLGSFILPLLIVPFFYNFAGFEIIELLFVSIITSLFCQSGDIFISYLKRKARLKDTGQFLPGHGGMLDRIDGILFAIPLGTFVWQTLISV